MNHSDTTHRSRCPDLNAADSPGDRRHRLQRKTKTPCGSQPTFGSVFDVPVQVSAVLGRSKMDVGELLKLWPRHGARTRPPGR